MKTRMKLDLEKLSVDSFETSKEMETRGTVHSQVITSCGEPCTCDCGSDGLDCGDGTVLVRAAAVQ